MKNLKRYNYSSLFAFNYQSFAKFCRLLPMCIFAWPNKLVLTLSMPSRNDIFADRVTIYESVLSYSYIFQMENYFVSIPSSTIWFEFLMGEWYRLMIYSNIFIIFFSCWWLPWKCRWRLTARVWGFKINEKNKINGSDSQWQIKVALNSEVICSSVLSCNFFLKLLQWKW